MEKFKSYIGVLVALFFCTLLLPVQDRWRTSSIRMTPLDNLMVIEATLRHGEKWRFVDQVANFLQTCDDGKTPNGGNPTNPWDRQPPIPCMFLFDIVSVNFVIASLAYAYDADTEFDYWNKYSDYVKRSSEVGYEHSREILLPEITALSGPLGTAVSKYADKIKGELTVYIYLIASLTVAFVALLFKFRKGIGSAILFPISLAFRTAKSTAKKIHDEI